MKKDYNGNRNKGGIAYAYRSFYGRFNKYQVVFCDCGAGIDFPVDYITVETS